MDQTVCLIHSPLVALAVTCQHQLWMGRGPVKTRHSTVQVVVRRESKLFMKSVSLVISLIILLVSFIFNKEIFREFKLLTESAFDQTCCFSEEVLETLLLDDLLCLIFLKIVRLIPCVLVFLGLALGAQFALLSHFHHACMVWLRGP